MKKLFLLFACLCLTQCGVVHKSIKYSDLDVQTKMSASVFLDPVSPDKKTVWVQVRNTSDKPSLSVEPEIISSLQRKGYQIVQDPDQAHYILQANVLSVGKIREDQAFMSLNGGFGSAIQGVAGGAAIGALAGNNSSGGMLAGGLIGGLMGTVADAMAEVMTYNMTTDIQISERSNKTIITDKSNQTLKQGTSGATVSTFTEETNLKKYQTRIVSMAQQVNLKFEEALPELKKGLIQSLSGML